MPSLHFHVRGKDGKKATLDLTPNDYMIETDQELDIAHWLLGWEKSRKVCRPAFGVQEYSTLKNGPVWILGSPFFYKFNVVYDRSSQPASISFNRAACGSC